MYRLLILPKQRRLLTDRQRRPRRIRADCTGGGTEHFGNFLQCGQDALVLFVRRRRRFGWRRSLDGGDRPRFDLDRGQRFGLDRSLHRLQRRFGGGRRHATAAWQAAPRRPRRRCRGRGLRPAAAPRRRQAAPAVNLPSAAPRRMVPADWRRPSRARRAPGPRPTRPRAGLLSAALVPAVIGLWEGAAWVAFTVVRAGRLAAAPASGAAGRARLLGVGRSGRNRLGRLGARGLGHHPARARSGLDGGRCRRRFPRRPGQIAAEMRHQIAADRRGDAGGADLDELHGEAREVGNLVRHRHPRVRRTASSRYRYKRPVSGEIEMIAAPCR